MRTPDRSRGSSRSRRRPSTSTERVAAVVLAAGASTRYGGVKQHDLLPAVLAALAATSVDEVVFVEGAHTLPLPGVRVARCPDWERGPGASLRCGLSALQDDVEAAVIVLADGPALDPRAGERVL